MRKKRQYRLPFDAIYVATSKNTRIRMPKIRHQMSVLNFQVPVVEFYAPDSKLIRHAMDPIPMSGYCRDLSYAFQCTLSHYLICHASLAAGYEKVLIIEDDIQFMHDRDRLMTSLAELPEDADWAMVDWWPCKSATPWLDGTLVRYMQQHKNEHWVRWSNDFILRSTGAYIVSAKGRQAIINIQDSSIPGSPKFFWGNVFHAADEIFDRAFMQHFKLNCYVANPILARQAENAPGRGGNMRLYTGGQMTSPEFNLADYDWDFTDLKEK